MLQNLSGTSPSSPQPAAGQASRPRPHGSQRTLSVLPVVKHIQLGWPWIRQVLFDYPLFSIHLLLFTSETTALANASRDIT